MMSEEIQKDSYWRKASKRQPVHFQKGGKRVCQHSDTSSQVTVSGRSWQMRWFLRCSVGVTVGQHRRNLCTEGVKVETMQNVWNF